MEVITKWNWDYQSALVYQEACREEVRLNPKKIYLIFCSHPGCYTLGRGLQKNQFYHGEPLIEFDSESELLLNYPLYKIKRGGGLTFHYPGQIIIYPILKLTYYKIGVHDLMTSILEIIKNILETTFGLTELSVNNQLLGLWHQKQTKMASIGLALSHFVTNHGMALNFFNDAKTFQALQSVYPCGLPGSIYQSVESVIGATLSIDSRLQIIELFKIEFEKTLSQFSGK
jgi:lipoate-protein ligase B